MLRQKRNVYSKEELENKEARLERLSDNLDVLREMFEEQNAFE